MSHEQRFEALFKQHSTSILGYLVRRVDAAEDAADLMAEVFAIAWRRIHDAPPGDEGRLWLYGIARKVLANHRRGSTRRGRLADRLREQLRAQPGDDGGGQPVRAALERLSVADRELLTLTAWEQMSPGEIAVVLGLEPATVRTRLSRARARLRAVLDEHARAAAPC
ncbi:RNA polymerase sigma factor [Actinomadura rudentiformis]|uniref:Sigma-70 family RNA polymerase sigma factor n=1 Tax=Actinomadura rudentiformis TaxID=359158 RepID=A0A6H9Z7F8_9ACTN|nr:sigma-70 family RNA polymerase sigma factor [Actinomadura rudentiformis]KAB2350928.1 sigma-70 family RNA polymerase sigma factor [Actinomadura rudentiformis]